MELTFILEDKLYIAQKLGMVDFKIKIERGSWDLEAILDYVQKLKTMKWDSEIDWGGEVYAVHIEDGTSRWYKHYSVLIRIQKGAREEYKRINDIIRDVEDTFIEFQDTLINAKATIAILRSNKATIDKYADKLEEIDKAEKHFDLQILKTIKHATCDLKAKSYQGYLILK